MRKYICLVVISVLLLLPGCNQRNMDETKMSNGIGNTTQITPEPDEIITYSDVQLSEIAESEMSKDQLVGQYPATYTRTVSIVQDDISNATSAVAVHYWGETKVLQLMFDDNSGNKLSSRIYNANCLKSAFEALAVGQPMSDVQTIDPEGDYVFLYTGRRDVPRVSTHYTTDGFLINITYNEDDVIEKIDLVDLDDYWDKGTVLRLEGT